MRSAAYIIYRSNRKTASRASTRTRRCCSTAAPSTAPPTGRKGRTTIWRDLGTTLAAQLARYDRVIWMQTCAAVGAYDGAASNTCRFEDADAAVASGNLLAILWSGHPRLVRIDAFADLNDKIEAVRAHMS